MRKKNTSDRKKLKTKYTDQKKRKQRRIKIKKDMKNNPNKYHKKKSDPGVPNSAPFKLALLDERDRYLEEKEREKQRKRALVLKARQAMRDTNIKEKRKLTEVLDFQEKAKEGGMEDSDDSGNEEGHREETRYPDAEMKINTRPTKRRKTSEKAAAAAAAGDQDMEGDDEERQEKERTAAAAKLLARKAKRQLEQFKTKLYYCKNNPVKPDPDDRFHNWSDRVFYKQVKQVVEAADVLLEVVDARDPMGTRCPVLESIVRSRPSKKLVFVLNKADLIPKSNLQAWLKYFRAEGPTVAFKAATHRAKKFKKTVQRWVHMGEESLRTPSSMGSDVLMQLLKNYARSFKGMGIVVGVVGLPNVGKSSLINSLKKIKTCDVAPIPGTTRFVKEIKLDAKLHLLDCPGVVLPGRDIDPIDAVLRNLVKLETIHNCTDVALEIFKRSDSLKLAIMYEVPKVDDGEQFLAHLARRCKKMIKNGLTDKEAAAKKLIYDWNHGILKYYTIPPQRTETEIATSLVSKLSSPFDLDTVASLKEDKFLSYMNDGRPSTTMTMAASKPMTSCYGLEEDEEEEEEEERRDYDNGGEVAGEEEEAVAEAEEEEKVDGGEEVDDGEDTSDDDYYSDGVEPQESDNGAESRENNSGPENSDADSDDDNSDDDE